MGRNEGPLSGRTNAKTRREERAKKKALRKQADQWKFDAERREQMFLRGCSAAPQSHNPAVTLGYPNHFSPRELDELTGKETERDFEPRFGGKVYDALKRGRPVIPVQDLPYLNIEEVSTEHIDATRVWETSYHGPTADIDDELVDQEAEAKAQTQRDLETHARKKQAKTIAWLNAAIHDLRTQAIPKTMERFKVAMYMFGAVKHNAWEQLNRGHERMRVFKALQEEPVDNHIRLAIANVAQSLGIESTNEVGVWNMEVLSKFDDHDIPWIFLIACRLMGQVCLRKNHGKVDANTFEAERNFVLEVNKARFLAWLEDSPKGSLDTAMNDRTFNKKWWAIEVAYPGENEVHVQRMGTNAIRARLLRHQRHRVQDFEDDMGWNTPTSNTVELVNATDLLLAALDSSTTACAQEPKQESKPEPKQNPPKTSTKVVDGDALLLAALTEDVSSTNQPEAPPAKRQSAAPRPKRRRTRQELNSSVSK